MQDHFDHDFREPHPRVNIGGRWIRFKHTPTDEGIFYAPTYVSPLLERRGWRVRMNLTQPRTDLYFGGSNQTLETSLNEAWRFIVQTLLKQEYRKPVVRKKEFTDLDTGVTGVRLAWNKGSEAKGTLLIRVLQSIQNEKAFHVTFYSFRNHGLSRSAFNRQYRKAIAARRYYEHLRLKSYRLDEPIRPTTTIPPEFFPRELPVPDLYDRMIEALTISGSPIEKAEV